MTILRALLTFAAGVFCLWCAMGTLPGFVVVKVGLYVLGALFMSWTFVRLCGEDRIRA